eukprot:CAMPEP_0198504802 /NCGR_PEP_ID=MMETSP1462-20131121/10682_1 /TAXON_ID=1333877 /ORGANISM="Brandtodinium nutriculum, Strain RCC3387" /LENGTH=831 /DNA_ID=CAMNT_0044233975 /DNA_START=90 /DNA_END=2585 /DNA_ORIENTATION=+
MATQASEPRSEPSTFQIKKSTTATQRLATALSTKSLGWSSTTGNRGSVVSGANANAPAQRSDFFGRASLTSHRAFEAVAGQAWGEDTQIRQKGLLPGEDGSHLRWVPPQEVSHVHRRPPREYERMAHAFLQAKAYQAVMLALTVGILYVGDLIQYTSGVSADTALVWILCICLVLFGTEWVLNIVSSALQRPGYVCSLFFFLDFIATVSIALDIIVLGANDLSNQGPIARAARAARIGTRAGRSMRMLRLLRFMRLVRIVRVLKALLLFTDAKARKRSQSSGELEGSLSIMRADTIGAQIGATTTRKVVIMTLMLLMTLPLLERNDSVHACSAELIELIKAVHASDAVGGDCTRLRAEIEPWFVPDLVPFSRAPTTGLTQKGLMFAQVDGCQLYSNPAIMGQADRKQLALAEQRRAMEIQVVPCDARFIDKDEDSVDHRSDSYFLYDMRAEEVEVSRYSMGFTTVVVVTLLGFSLIFSQDAENLAAELVTPIGQLMEDMTYTSRLEMDKVRPEEDMFESSVLEVRRLQAAYLNLNGCVESFVKFMPLEVVRHFLMIGQEAELGVHQRNVSIFFSDIVGFEEICADTSPVDVLALLSEYFECMVSAIIKEQGTMLEFIGDSILAIWNAPNSVDDHAVRAVTSVLQMHAELVTMRQCWLDQGKPDIRINCGIHSADVFVGNLGSKMRMKYGVLGDGVNLASRLEGLNARYNTEIMISEDMFHQAKVSDTFLLRPIDRVVVKGRVKPTLIYEVLADRETGCDKFRQIARLSSEAMEAYTDRDFCRALELLSAIRVLRDGQDPQGELLRAHCEQFVVKPPPPDWDGSEVLAAKHF